MSTATASVGPPGPGDADGRSTRWAAHRASRREELVEATLRAIRAQGATVGMDDIAAAAGTSKTVFYRHFTDRAGLYAAVSERVLGHILRDLERSVSPERSERLDGDDRDDEATDSDSALDPRAVLTAAIGAYLGMVEHDPEVYRFIVTAPLVPSGERSADMASTMNDEIAGRATVLLEVLLSRRGQDVAPARTWAHAVVGMVRAAADRWLSDGATASGCSRDQVTADLVTLVWGGLSSAPR